MLYELQILGNLWGAGGLGYGINHGGEVAGKLTITGGHTSELPAAWLQGYPDAPRIPGAPLILNGQLLKVDDYGNAVGEVLEQPVIVSVTSIIYGPTTVAQLRSILGEDVVPSDINNGWTITGTDLSGASQDSFGSRAFIYTFLPMPGNQMWLLPLLGSTGIRASAINASGDVVGGCDNSAGFFYSASTKKMTGIDSCFLFDINANQRAVGVSVSGPPSNTDQPVMVDLSLPNPAPQPIPIPKAFVGATATAVNSGGTIVGFCNTETSIDVRAFVSYNGVGTFDLNDLLTRPHSDYTLIDAMDINDAGQIVGTAVLGPPDQPTGVYPYVATPFHPARSWPPPVWQWPWGWLPYPGLPPYPGFPSNPFGPSSPMIRLSSPVSGMPITGEQPPDLQKMMAAHRARISRPTASNKHSGREGKA